MPRITHSRCVLAVQDLAAETRFYVDVLGFKRDPVEAAGWSFLSRDGFCVMLGECRDALPARELGDHSWYVHLLVDDVDAFHADVVRGGGEILSPPTDKPWGLREFCLRTPGGHRIVIGQRVGGRGA